jgi:cation transport ATPase
MGIVTHSTTANNSNSTEAIAATTNAEAPLKISVGRKSKDTLILDIILLVPVVLINGT